MSSGLLLVLGASVLWILFCMRFWWAIDRDNVWQRRFIAIGAGVGGGLVYLMGSLMLELLKEPEAVQTTPVGESIRVTPSAPPKPEAGPAAAAK